DEVFARRIFGPLGMRDTGFRVAPENRERVAALYTTDPENGLTAVPHRLVDLVSTERPPFFAGGGSFHSTYSTAGDYHRFQQLLLRGGELDAVRILRPETVELMSRNHLPGGKDIAEVG